MKNKLKEKFITEFNNDFSKEIFDLTYAYGDEDINERLYKVAETVASVETDKEYWTEKFYETLSEFKFVPGGRILSNAGIPVKGTTFLNCFVSGLDGEDQDSMEGILRALRKQALILKSEGGYGACVDVLRPRGGYISGIANESPGAVKMLELWDKQSEVITEGSGKKSNVDGSKKKIRKGAQLLALSVTHPDIEEFITAKQTPGKLTKCNMSVLITDEFMDCVKNHKPWDLVFPDFDSKLQFDYVEKNYPGLTVKDVYKKEWDGNLKNWKEKGLPVKIYKTLTDANILWDLIMQSTYNRNEPGVLFIDKINKLNNLYYTEYINATNPCGEIPLPIGGSCLLGSLNLTKFIDKNGSDWDYDNLKSTIQTAVRFLDDVNDITYVPLEEQRTVLQNKRRIGLGIMGYGSALLMLKKRYGGKAANELTEKLMDFIANTAYQTSANLAKEKGAFPEFIQDKYMAGHRIALLSDETKKMISDNGIRNSHLLMCAPTGNTGVLANNISGGMEPTFSFMYKRTFIIPYPPDGMELPAQIDWVNKTYVGNQKWEWIKEADEDQLVTIYNGILYKIDKNRGLLKETDITDYGVKYLIDKGEWDKEADYAVNTENLNIDEHLTPMDIITKQICSSVSKTINLPNEYPYEDFKNVYLKAYDTDAIKGITTYRDGTMASVMKTDKPKNKIEHTDTIERNGHIIRHAAPMRPKSVPCDVHQITSAGIKWYVFVGMVTDQKEKLSPYEVFAFKKKNISFNVKSLHGVLTKVKRGRYDFESENGLVLEDLASLFEVDEQEALTRMISTSLRHGVEIKFVVEQLNKAEGNISVFSKAVARCLKKYIPDNEIPTDETDCDGCGAKNSMIYIEGCVKCKHCGWSKC